ncbi:MAG: carboxypeptidase-like regulatory domain-containing protein [Vicinamibacterales bacterium]
MRTDARDVRVGFGKYLGAAAIALGALVLLPGVARAQSAFSGTVRDTSGAVLPGVTVEAASPVLIEKARSVITDEAGRYTVVDLRPGTYKITFTLSGFSAFVRDGVDLPGNTTVTINAELRVGSLEESITVSGQAPLVDVQNAQRTQVVEREVLDALPTTRNMQSVGSIVPGVKLSRPDVGGSQGMEQTYMRTHGADDRHTSMQVDGMSVNSSMGDGNIQAYNDDALAQQVVFQTSALPAEVAAGGVRVNMIPKDGGNSVKGGGFFGGTASSWQANNLDDELRARGFRFRNFVDHVQDFNFNIGGPLKRDRLWYFSTARHVSVDEGVGNSFYPADYDDSQGISHKAGDPSIQHQYVRDVLLRLTYQATSKTKIASVLRAHLEAQGSRTAVRIQPDHGVGHPRSEARALLRGAGEGDVDADQPDAARGRLLHEHRASQPALSAGNRVDRRQSVHPGAVHGRDPLGRERQHLGCGTGRFDGHVSRSQGDLRRAVVRHRLALVEGGHAVVVRRRRQLADSHGRSGPELQRRRCRTELRGGRPRELRAEHGDGVQHADPVLRVRELRPRHLRAGHVDVQASDAQPRNPL